MAILQQDNTKENFKIESTTVWSFPQRGKWATHSGNYRGNWAPQVVKNIILRYSKPKDLVLDQMVGSGTTLIECVLNNRRGIGLDINPAVVKLAKKNLEFEEAKKKTKSIKLKVGDARQLEFIPNETIDLVLTHPPYANMIRYGKGEIKGDLSDITSIDKFYNEILLVAKEAFRVLKKNKYCAILIGDTRRKQHYVPLAFRVMHAFLKAGFILKEDIIKLQHNCRGTGMWKGPSAKYNFHLIMHEHLFVFRKPINDNDKAIYRESSTNLD